MEILLTHYQLVPELAFAVLITVVPADCETEEKAEGHRIFSEGHQFLSN